MLHEKRSDLSGVPGALSSEAGSAMLFVVVIAFIGAIVMSSLFFTSRVAVRKGGDRRENVTILNIAEAGKEDGIAKVKAGKVTPVAGTRIAVAAVDSFGGGGYQVSCSASAALDSLWIYSTAFYEGRTKTIEVLYGVTLASPAGGAAFGLGICVGGNVTWHGSGCVNAGSTRMHCNGNFTMTGSSDIRAYVTCCGVLSKSGSSKIIGDVWALDVLQVGSGTISGTVTKGTVPSVEIPVLDLEPYREHAVANGQFYSGDEHLHGSDDYTVPGGIMWVEGDFKRTGSGDFFGCVIATGDVDVSGSGDYYKVEKYPLAVSIEGKIDFSGSGDVRGLLFVQNGFFEKTGLGNVIGSIICKDNFDKSGSWDFLTYEECIPVPPGGNTATYRVLSWREL